MQRREFTGCAAAFSLLACQKAFGQAEREAIAEGETPRRQPKAAGKLKLTHSTVDIALVCSDFQESLRFYHEQLGLEIVQDLQIPDAVAQGAGLAPRGFRQVRLRAGQTLIKLMDIAAPPPQRTADFAAGVRWLTFFVDDLHRTVERLKADGVKFLADPVAAPDAAGVACAVDPDGILIELVQLKA
ncbi:MAG: VOC family protein [Pirellulaceae bacterium]|nr:VOC family protein [Pirellulaceae bacterium]